MKAFSEDRQRKLYAAMAKIFAQSFSERMAGTLELFSNEIAALTEAVVENHKAAVAEWRKGVDAENERTARDTNADRKRLSTLVPVSVYACHKNEEHRTLWVLKLFFPGTKRMSRRQRQIPINPKTGRHDWRLLGVLSKCSPDLVEIFRQTDSMARHLVFMSRHLKKAREALAIIDDHRNLMMGLKARRSKKQKFGEAKTESPPSKPDAT